MKVLMKRAGVPFELLFLIKCSAVLLSGYCRSYCYGCVMEDKWKLEIRLLHLNKILSSTFEQGVNFWLSRSTRDLLS
jgi:hypothetical protein